MTNWNDCSGKVKFMADNAVMTFARSRRGTTVERFRAITELGKLYEEFLTLDETDTKREEIYCKMDSIYIVYAT